MCIRDRAHDANDVRVRTPALCGHTAPDTGLAVSAGTAVDKVELLSTDYNVQMVRQAGEKMQDHIPLMGRPVVEQFPVGGRTTILPPQVLRAILIMRTGSCALILIAVPDG